MLILAGTLLIGLTMADGGKVYINPAFITKLYPTKEAAAQGGNQLVVKGARCVVTMGDGRFLAVLEPCDYVANLVEGKPQPRGR